MVETFEIATHDAMQAFGRRLSASLRPGDVVLLHGDLGAGKTTLVQGIASGFGVDEVVQSPTFTLVAQHEGTTSDGTPIMLHHLDLYRLTDASELESFDYDTYLQPAAGISLIEWPERADDWLPERFLLIRIEYVDGGGRSITIEHMPPDAW